MAEFFGGQVEALKWQSVRLNSQDKYVQVYVYVVDMIMLNLESI
jgi:hypothetical protein